MPGSITAPAQGSPGTATHIGGLDALRGIAVLSVMLYHFLGVASDAGFHIPRLFEPIVEGGWIGVDIFFVLSGYLITGILTRDADRPGYFRRFYGRRVLRIFPLYYFVLLVVFFILPDSESLRVDQGWFWLYGSNVLTAVRNAHLATPYVSLNHFWSLSIEEHFYFVWPLVVYMTRARRGALVASAIVLVVISVVARELVHSRLGGRGAYVLTPCRLDGLAAGALLSIVGRDLRPTRWSRAIGIGCGLVCVGIAMLRGGLSPHDHVTQMFAFPAVALGAGVLLVEARAGVSAIWSSRFLRSLGKYSYGIYVFHGLVRPSAEKVLRLIVSPTGGAADSVVSIAFVVVASVASIGMAVASYHLLEIRFLALKDRWFSPARTLTTERS